MDKDLNQNYNFSVLLSICDLDNDDYFDISLSSIFQNSIQPFEIIIVVNGRINDKKEKILNTYKSKCINLNICRLNNLSNFATALNYGLKFINTNWVMRQDPDDISTKYRFEKIMNKIKIGFDICGSNMIENSLLYEGDKYLKKVPKNHNDILNYLKSKNPFCHPTVCINYALLKKFNYPDLPLKEDYGLWSLILKEKDVTTHNIQEPLVETCNSSNQINRRGGIKHFHLELNLQKTLLKHQHISIPRFIFNLFFRGLLLCMPNNILRIIYKFNRITVY
ncbi:MAG: glycosyltransferase [Alphaproteobacteria bacterium]